MSSALALNGAARAAITDLLRSLNARRRLYGSIAMLPDGLATSRDRH